MNRISTHFGASVLTNNNWGQARHGGGSGGGVSRGRKAEGAQDGAFLNFLNFFFFF